MDGHRDPQHPKRRAGRSFWPLILAGLTGLFGFVAFFHPIDGTVNLARILFGMFLVLLVVSLVLDEGAAQRGR